jgi:hypothetical protein
MLIKVVNAHALCDGLAWLTDVMAYGLVRLSLALVDSSIQHYFL